MTDIVGALWERGGLIYKNGAHYIPVFIPGGGSEVDERKQIAETITTLRAQLAKAVEGLEAINNERTVDYLLSDKDIARTTLAAIKGEKKE